jgi:hypothetical protein
MIQGFALISAITVFQRFAVKTPEVYGAEYACTVQKLQGFTGSMTVAE